MTRVYLDLSNRCIQTAIKKKYNRLLAACLQPSPPAPETEEQVELLKYALERFDFPRLRAQYTELAGNYDGEVILVADDDSRPVITIAGQRVIPAS